jgi:HNH endonuclease/AP2 domain
MLLTTNQCDLAMAKKTNTRRWGPYQTRNDLTAEVIRGFFAYNPETGEFRRKNQRQRSRIRPAKQYRLIRFKGVLYKEHRLIWLHYYGRWPSKIVDHANGDRDDHRIVNLREASQSNNTMNSRLRSDNTSGFKGVHWKEKLRKWGAVICKDGKRYHIGYFSTPEVAHAAYCKEAERLFGVFARLG